MVGGDTADHCRFPGAVPLIAVAITLSRPPPAIADVTDVGLDVGAVGASAQLAGCDALEDDTWGTVVASTFRRNLAVAMASAVSTDPVGVERDYGVASLDLRLDSPLVGALVTVVNATVVQLDAAVQGLGGRDGVLAKTVNQGVLGLLGTLTGGLGLGTLGGDVVVTGPDLAAAVRPLLAEPVADPGGTLSLDLSAGTVRVDLAHLLGDGASGLNDLPPNHELVLDATTLSALADRLGAVVDAWAARITTALTTALRTVHVSIALAANVSASLGILGRLDVATLSIGLDTGVGALMDGQTKVSVSTKLLGLDLGPLLGVVTGLATALVDPLTQALVGTLTTSLFGLVGSLGTTLTSTIGGPLVTAAGAVLTRVPGILSVRINVQEDSVPGVTGGTGRTGRHTETALRVTLADALVPGGLARIDLATAVVGPATVQLARSPV